MATKNRNKNSTKSCLFMATVVATICLAVTAPVLMWKNHKTLNQYSDYKIKAENRIKMETMMHDMPQAKTLEVAGGKITGKAADYEFTYTVDPAMQKAAEEALQKFDPNILEPAKTDDEKPEPYMAAIVAIDPTTGAIKAMASYSTRRKAYYKAFPYYSILDPITRNSIFPLASVQKLITSSAALETGAAQPNSVFECRGGLGFGHGQEVPCSRGQAHGQLELSQALAKSCNVIFAKLALSMKPQTLALYYDKYMFNRRIDFDMPLAESVFTMEPGEFGLARAGCGLDAARVSPLHAAMVAAAISNGGVMMRPYIISGTKHGGDSASTEPRELTRPITPETAAKLSAMMSSTVEEGGTGYKNFGKTIGDEDGSLAVNTKTGSVNENSAQEHYTWFVGFVDKGNPKIAFAVMVMNDETRSKLHAVNVAREFFLSILNVQKTTPDDR